MTEGRIWRALKLQATAAREEKKFLKSAGNDAMGLWKWCLVCVWLSPPPNPPDSVTTGGSRVPNENVRPPSGCPTLEMHRIYSSFFSPSLWFSRSSLQAFPVCAFVYRGVIFVSSTPAWHRHTELCSLIVCMFLYSAHVGFRGKSHVTY